MHLRRALLPLLAAALVAGPAAYAATAPTSASAPAPSFLPAVPLLDSKGASTLAAEPSLEVDSKGNVYVSGPAGVPTGGCPFWEVHPDSLTSGGLPYDYRGTIDTDHASVGGGDCDISITPHDGGHDQVSVTSLSLANLTSNTTSDGGQTFQPVANPASQQVFGVDRQWQASDPGLDRHYLTVHDLATTNIQTSVSTDGGYQYVQNTPAINPTEAPGATTMGGNHFGTTVVNPVNHHLYIPFLAPGDAQGSEPEHVVYVAEGDPCGTLPCTKGQPAGPITWTDHVVYTAPSTVKLSHIFPAIAIDRTGQVYVAWTGDTTKPATAGEGQDANRIFFTHSAGTDASTWTAPVAIDPGTAHSNMFPWLVAGDAGKVAAAWYQSTLSTTTSTCGTRTGTVGDANGVNNDCLNDWTVGYAQTDDAGATFTRATASGVLHEGSVCDSGTTCLTIGGDRTLLDFFDVGLDPQGRPNIAFVSDVDSPGTAVIEYTRQCGGTSLTGVALSGPCGALGTSAACPADAAYTDAAGDANSTLGVTTPVPSDPALDVVGGSVSTSPAGLVLSVSLQDLAPGQVGQIVEQHFSLDGKGYYVTAQRSTGDGAITYVYGTSDATTYRGELGSTTGTFDDTTDTVTTVFPSTAATPFTTGSVLTGLQVTTRRDGVVAVPDADTATAPCSYTVGAQAAPSPTATSTGTATASPTASPTGTAAPTSTGTPTTDPTPTATATPTSTAAPTSTATPKGGPKPKPSPTASCTPKGNGKGGC